MLKSYFKIAWRNITKHKVFSLINVVGIAIGICGFLVISLIVHYDLSFDNFHPDKERIYRLVGDLKTASGEDIDLNRAPYSLQLIASAAMFQVLKKSLAFIPLMQK